MEIDVTSKETRAAFYNSRDWKAKRQEILEHDHYECQMCKAEGRVTTGDHATLEVDHIKELERHPELALDNDNLRTLCKQCHNKRHKRGFKYRQTKKQHKWNDERWD